LCCLKACADRRASSGAGPAAPSASPALRRLVEQFTLDAHHARSRSKRSRSRHAPATILQVGECSGQVHDFR
jgi:hypothetical protein